MNRDDVTHMAREAGFEVLLPSEEVFGRGGVYTASDDEISKYLEAFAALVASAERERIKQANAPEIERINAHIKELEDAVISERENTNNAYKERNQLVALLTTLFPSGKAKTAIEGWDEAWHGCVYIDFPWGQASWHYHTDDEWMFEHLPPYTKQWDGHTTDAKYRAIAKAIRARGQA